MEEHACWAGRVVQDYTGGVWVWGRYGVRACRTERVCWWRPRGHRGSAEHPYRDGTGECWDVDRLSTLRFGSPETDVTITVPASAKCSPHLQARRIGVARIFDFDEGFRRLDAVKGSSLNTKNLAFLQKKIFETTLHAHCFQMFVFKYRANCGLVLRMTLSIEMNGGRAFPHWSIQIADISHSS